jgi:hypothetical protein
MEAGRGGRLSKQINSGLQQGSTRSLRGIFFIVLFIDILPSSAFSQNENIATKPPLDIEFEHLSMEEGLSNQNAVKAIRDSEGFLWVATSVSFLKSVKNQL